MSKSHTEHRWVLAIGLLFSLTCGCEPPIPSGAKTGLPPDHDVAIEGVLHRTGYEAPYLSGNWCADPRCHHTNLRGGPARLGVGQRDRNELAVAPSCYQCHGELWEVEYPAALRIEEPQAGTVWPHGHTRYVEWWGPPAAAYAVTLVRDQFELELGAMGSRDGVFPIPRVSPDWIRATDYQIRVEDSEGRVAISRPFSVCPPAAIPTVSNPHSASVVRQGEELLVGWDCASGAVVDLYLYRNDERIDIVRAGAGNNGAFLRPFPTEWGTGFGYQIELVDEDGNVGRSESFRILGPGG